MRKLEGMIRKNLDLEIPMKYPKRMPRIHVWKYCIPVVIVLILGIVVYPSNKFSVPNTLAVEDLVVINQVHLDGIMDRTDSTLKYMYEIEKLINLFDQIPFMSMILKHWTLEHYLNRYVLTYKKNNITLMITIAKMDANMVKYERNLQVSMIEEIPVTIINYDDYYQAHFEHKDYFYYIISHNIEESSFTQLLKQMIHYLKSNEGMEE